MRSFESQYTDFIQSIDDELARNLLQTHRNELKRTSLALSEDTLPISTEEMLRWVGEDSFMTNKSMYLFEATFQYGGQNQRALQSLYTVQNFMYHQMKTNNIYSRLVNQYAEILLSRDQRMSYVKTPVKEFAFRREKENVRIKSIEMTSNTSNILTRRKPMEETVFSEEQKMMRMTRFINDLKVADSLRKELSLSTTPIRDNFLSPLRGLPSTLVVNEVIAYSLEKKHRKKSS